MLNKRKVLSLILIILLNSCKNITSQKDIALQFFEDNPVTINWQKDSDKKISSFSADVKVFFSDSRDVPVEECTDVYRLYTKKINGKDFLRLDFDKDDDNCYRSIVSNESEMVIINNTTGAISEKINIESNEIAKDLSFLDNQMNYSRVDINNIKKIANKLSLDIIEDSSSVLEVSLPLLESAEINHREFSEKNQF